MFISSIFYLISVEPGPQSDDVLQGLSSLYFRYGFNASQPDLVTGTFEVLGGDRTGQGFFTFGPGSTGTVRELEFVSVSLHFRF